MDLDQLFALPAGRRTMVVASIHPVGRKRLLDEAFARLTSERRLGDPRALVALGELTVELSEHTGQEVRSALARLEMSNALRRLGHRRRAAAALRAHWNAAQKAEQLELPDLFNCAVHSISPFLDDGWLDPVRARRRHPGIALERSLVSALA